MNNIRKEVKKNGEVGYKAHVYLGIDAITQKQRQTVVRGRTKAQVKDKIIAKRIEFKKNGHTTVKKKNNSSDNQMTFSELYEEWRTKRYAPSVEQSTLQATMTMARLHILPLIGDVKLADLNVNDCQEIFDRLMKLEYSNINKAKNLGIRILQYAIDVGYMEKNPFRLVEVHEKKWTVEEQVEKEKKAKLKSYSTDEFVAFMKCSQKEAAETNTKRWHAFYLLLFTSGLRFGEVTALRWGDVDFEKSDIAVRRAYSIGLNNQPYLKKPKTKNSVRDIVLMDTTKEILREWKKEQAEDYSDRALKHTDETLIFPNEDDDRLAQSTVKTKIDTFVEKYNLKRITPHGFRHTFSTLMYQANEGAKQKEIQRLMGHSTMAMTNEVYTHAQDEEKIKAVQKLENHVKL